MTAPVNIEVPNGIVVRKRTMKEIDKSTGTLPIETQIRLRTCQICGKIGASARSIGGHIKQHKITSREYYQKFFSGTCIGCGGERKFAKKSVSVAIKRKWCSGECRSRHMYRGRHVGKGGYIIRNLAEYPDPVDRRLADAMAFQLNGRGVLEHRMTMARYLGRPLARHEQVHHRNGNRADNRLENLELRIGPHGSGADAAALLCPHCGKTYV